MEKQQDPIQASKEGQLENAGGSLSAVPPKQLFADDTPVQRQNKNGDKDHEQEQQQEQAPPGITMERANEVFQALQSLTFENSRGEQQQVPYHFPPDGCYARAHLMAQAMEGMGITSEKIFVMSQRQDGSGGLTVASDYSPTPNVPSITWRYHVAPVVNVIGEEGGVTRMVMDPSVSSRPLTVSEWIGLMSPDEFSERTVDEVQELANNNGGNPFVNGDNYYYFSPQEHFWPADFNATPQSADANMDSVRDTLTQYADQTVITEFIAAVRQQARAEAPGVEAVIQAGGRFPAELRPQVWTYFLSEINGDFKDAVSEEDFNRLRDFMNP